MATRAEFDQLLNSIYQDNPTWWPHGLKRAQLDEAFAIRDPATRKLAGFTGWQFRNDQTGKKAGYYAVGLLPEFRRQGLAKRALQEMFQEHKPADVQDVRAYIVPGNEPSLKLADKLGVPVQHKMARLRSQPLPSMLTKMARRPSYVPGSYGGVSLQQYMPLAPRRAVLNPEEQANVEEGQSQWFPKLFRSMADSPAVDMSSPAKASLMTALVGGGAVGAGAHFLGAKPEHTAMAGGGAALLSGLLGYHSRKANNEGIIEMMRRLPPGGTRRDMLADPVLQQELNRESQTGASEEALRTAQLLAVLKATSKTAAVKQAGWPEVAKALWTGTKYMAAPTAGAVGMDALYNAPSGRFLTTEHWKERLADGLLNTTMFGIGKGTGRLPGVSALAKAEAAKRPVQLTIDAAKRLKMMGGATGMAVAIPGVFAKDLMRRNMNTGSDLVAALSKERGTNVNVTAPANTSVNVTSPSIFDQASQYIDKNPGTAIAGGLLGAGLLGGVGYLGLKGINALQGVADRAERPESGRIRVTLPTKNKGDAETQLDLPVQEMALSDALVGKIRRDVRGRLRHETNERTKRVILSPEERQRRAELLASYRNNAVNV
jgi:hypothetical protein